MVLADKKQQLSQGSQLGKSASTPQKQEKKDTPIFGGKAHVKMSDIRQNFSQRKSEIFTKYRLTEKQGKDFAQRLAKHGGYLDRNELRKVRKELEIEKRSNPNIKKRIEAGNKLKLLESRFGKN